MKKQYMEGVKKLKKAYLLSLLFRVQRIEPKEAEKIFQQFSFENPLKYPTDTPIL